MLHLDLQSHPPATTTTREIPEHAQTALTLAALEGDEEAFLCAAQLVEWEQEPADEIVQAVRRALSAGAHRAARELAERGAQRFPHHALLNQMSRTLAPPRVTARSGAVPGLRANHQWLRDHAETHRDQWVALRAGELLATAASLTQLRASLDDVAGVLLTRVR